MKVLVVGGAGYLGSVLSTVLASREHAVTVVDLFWFGDHLKDPSIKKVQKDARGLTANDLEGFDAMIYVAGLSNDPMADFQPLMNYEMNAALPTYLADQALKAGIKTFIHGGSCSVYGKVDKVVNERCPPLTVTPYGLSKLLGEIGCLQYGKGSDMRVVAFRMGTICGYSPRMRFDLVINAMVKDALIEGKINVNDPEAKRPILNIKDAVNAYIYALLNPSIRGAINLASFNTTVGEIASNVQAAIHEDSYRKPGSSLPKIVNHNIPDKRSYTVDTSRAQKFGIYPSSSCRQTITELIEKLNQPLRDRSDEDIFYNVRVFRNMWEGKKAVEAL